MTSPIPILNGHGALALTEAQQTCVDLLSEALLEAKAGNITSVGIVCCMKGGFASVMAGMQEADLNLGCDELKRKILDAVTSGDVGSVRSRLVRARSS